MIRGLGVRLLLPVSASLFVLASGGGTPEGPPRSGANPDLLRSAPGTAFPAAAAPAARAIPAAAPALLPPLDRPAGLTATFGEYRFLRLHAGIDYSTREECGWPVRAAADGEIVKVRVEWRGYGNALYLRHPRHGGITTVYAHLESFEDAALGLQTRVEARRKRTGRRYFGEMELLPPIPVKAGQVIGFSGESGVGPPHLHFETRAPGNRPTLPSRLGLPLPIDPDPPVLESLILEPLLPAGSVEGTRGALEVPLAPGTDGVFRPAGRIRIVPSIYLPRLRAHDPFERESRGGLQRLRALAGSGERGKPFEVRLDDFSFDGVRVEHIFDRARTHLVPTTYAYYLADPDAGLPLGPSTPGLTVEAWDAAGNRSEARAEFDFGEPHSAVPFPHADPRARVAGPVAILRRDRAVEIGPASPGAPVPEVRATIGDREIYRGTPSPSAAFPDPPDVPGSEIVLRSGGREIARLPRTPLPRGAGALIEQDGLRFEIPPGGSRSPAVLRVETGLVEDPGPLPRLSPVYSLLPDAHPLGSGATLSIALPPSADPARVGIYGWDPFTRAWGFLSDDWDPRSRRFSAELPLLGTIALLRDDLPPRIGEPACARGRIRVPVRETGEGIGRLGVSLVLDGVPLDAEYDPDRQWAVTWEQVAPAPGPHVLEVRAEDLAGNVSRATLRFEVPADS